jgi:hypothetical protein
VHVRHVYPAQRSVSIGGDNSLPGADHVLSGRRGTVGPLRGNTAAPSAPHSSSHPAEIGGRQRVLVRPLNADAGELDLPRCSIVGAGGDLRDELDLFARLARTRVEDLASAAVVDRYPVIAPVADSPHDERCERDDG